MLIILSGPPGAGKSSVGYELAKRFPLSANFSLDTLRSFIVGGYVPPWEDTDEIEQLSLASEIALEMIKKYTAKGYVVILDDVLDDEGILFYKKYFPDLRAFLLLPTIEVLHQRDVLRLKEFQMHGRIDELYAEFSQKEYRELEVIDSSCQTLQQTVELIYKKIS